MQGGRTVWSNCRGRAVVYFHGSYRFARWGLVKTPSFPPVAHPFYHVSREVLLRGGAILTRAFTYIDSTEIS